MELRGIPVCLTTMLFVSLSYLNFQQVDACTCARSHPSENFCKADYVIKAKVKTMRILTSEFTVNVNGQNRTYKSNYRQYGVKISKVFKAAPGLEVGKFVRLPTAEFDSMCGVTMDLDTMYVIQGSLDKDGSPARLILCNAPRKWLRLPTSMRKGYGYLYNKSCECQIKRCGTPGCGLDEENLGFCQYHRTNSVDECYMEHAVCLDNGQGMCKWSKRALFSKCVRQMKKPGSNSFAWEP